MRGALSLTVLGCDGSHAGAGGAASGYLVRCWASGTTVWVDAGPGTFANLQRFCDPTSLSAIVLSHRHRDHVSDLDGFVTAARWAWGWERDPVPVLAAPGVAEQLGEAAPRDGGRSAGDVVSWRTVDDDDEVRIGGLTLRFSRTDHGPPTLAVRLEGAGGVLGYSADSGPGWALASLGRDLDLALCEATYGAEHEGTAGHMSGRQAGRNAREAGARRLVLTHRWPHVPAGLVAYEAAEAFGGPLQLAAVGRGFSL